MTEAVVDFTFAQEDGLPSLVVSVWDKEGRPRPLLEGFPLLTVRTKGGGEGPLEIETECRRTAYRCFRLEHRLRAAGPLLLSSCKVGLRLLHSRGGSGDRSYRFVPHLHPLPGMVAADHCFRSPCIILEGGGFSVALLPDLGNLEELQRRGLRAAMALDGETMTYGIIAYEVRGHVFFRETEATGFPMREGDELILAWNLFVNSRPGPELHRAVNSFLWESEGRRRLLAGEPQRLPLLDAAALAARWAFLDGGNWVDLRMGGRACGGCLSWDMNSQRRPLRGDALTGAAFYLLPRLYAGVLGLGAARVTPHPPLFRALTRLLRTAPVPLPPVIQFQSWFNDLRSAYGAARLSGDLEEPLLAERARLVRELVLASPAPQGLFPAVLYLIGGRQLWKEGTRAFVHLRSYHLPDSCTTAYHLLEWHRDIEESEECLDACRRTAEELRRLQLAGGSFPAWVSYRRGVPRIDARLAESAESAAAVRFLALLGRLTGEERWLESAAAGGRFLRSSVVEREEWYDFEAFYSCSPKRPGWSDPRSGCLPQCTMSMYWTADALLQLYLADGDGAWLEAGRRALDRLLGYQQVWDPPALSINAFGGFSSQNTDAEWDDARQGIIAPLLADWFEASGEWELLERSAAALRASFTAMHLGEEPFPCLRPQVRGAISENYAHFGYDAPLPGYLETDWGAGSALYAAARILPRFGQAFVDLESGKGLGLDGCRVDGVEREGDELRLEITPFLCRDDGLRLMVRGARGPLEFTVNGKKAGRLIPEAGSGKDRYMMLIVIM